MWATVQPQFITGKQKVVFSVITGSIPQTPVGLPLLSWGNAGIYVSFILSLLTKAILLDYQVMHHPMRVRLMLRCVKAFTLMLLC
jgi:hypothetical protein